MMKKLVAILLAVALTTFGTALGEGADDYPITFVENPTTGYEWTYVISDEAILSVTDGGYVLAETDEMMVGAGGTHSWTVSGLKEGEAELTFTYARSWESDPADPVVVYTFAVDAEKSLTVVSAEGLPEKHMPNRAVVQLLENPTTGYLWEMEATPDGVLALMTDAYEQDKASLGAEGAGGVHTWIFSGETEGQVVLTFRYARSFEPEEKPVATVMFTYQVDEMLSVTLFSIDGDYEQYNPDAVAAQE